MYEVVEDSKKTDNQKEKELLASRFKNLSKYIEEPLMNKMPKLLQHNFLDDIITLPILYKYCKEERIDFYMELRKILNNNPRALYTILSLNNKIKVRRKKEKKIKDKIKSLMRKNTKNIDEKILEKVKKIYNLNGGTNGDDDWIKKFYDDTGANKDDSEKKLEKAQKMNEKIKNKIDDNKINFLIRTYGMKNLMNIREQEQNKTSNNKNKTFKDFLDKNDDSSEKINTNIIKDIFGEDIPSKEILNSLKITYEDRLIFMMVTFFIRYVTVLIVQWCIEINIVKDFYQGFLMYAFIYLVIFWFIVMFINIDNIPKGSYMNFDTSLNGIRDIFYYFYMGTNGITRLLTHSFLIIILLIIPIVLNIKHKKTDNTELNDTDLLDYDDRKKLIKTLSLFTLFIWILTSIIASKF
jgi:hypothetical protein